MKFIQIKDNITGRNVTVIYQTGEQESIMIKDDDIPQEIKFKSVCKVIREWMKEVKKIK